MSEKNGMDIVQKYGTAYAKTAPAILGDQHDYLMESVSRAMDDQNRDNSLLVIGHAENALPYTFHAEETGRIIGNGKLLMMDYNDAMINGALDFFEKGKFYERAGLRPGEVNPEGEIDPKDLEARTVTFKKADLRDDKLPYASNSVSCVDANLAIHHAIPYYEDLDKITSEIYRILESGGMFHYGTGNVDMKYSLTKIRRFAQDTADFFNKPVLAVDERMKEKEGDKELYVKKALFEPGKKQKGFNFVNSENGEMQIYIDIHGNMRIPTSIPDAKAAQRFRKHLNQKGYGLVSTAESAVIVPLIDASMPEDMEKHILPVYHYYEQINARAIRGGLPAPVIKGITEGSFYEAGNASRGVVEYYTGEKALVESLKKAGFIGINVKRHKVGPFYNITAFKLNAEDYFKGRNSI